MVARLFFSSLDNRLHGKANAVMEFLMSIHNSRKHCGDLFCGKCGIAREILENISDSDKQIIHEILSSISIYELTDFGVFEPLIHRIDAKGYISVFQRAAKEINSGNIRDIDFFLHMTRSRLRKKFENFIENFPDILRRGTELAITTKDYSLVETVILILEEEAQKYPELISTAREYAQNDQQMQRVLYNTLRRIRPEMRNFAGKTN
ncbi:MAG: hypothetical protein KJ950_13755 [Proteobacteria bacterium]|nr:hypothetical protein [Pseudomonadota bacterium]MBU1686074.1 hypothetical protein [Pseudomonadota bacterium]